MTRKGIVDFISKQKTAILSSIDENGYPCTRAMLAPRLICGDDVYFTTNTSSRKVSHYNSNNKACVYFYHRGLISYQGVMFKGTVNVCTDQMTKNLIWRKGDCLFYKQGKTDPDYCVIKFTVREVETYKDFKIETAILGTAAMYV